VTVLPTLYNLLAPHRIALLRALLCAAGICLLNVAAPLLMQAFVDHVAAGQSAVGMLAALVGVYGIQAVLLVHNARCIGRIGLRAACDLRRAVYDKFLHAQMRFLDQTPAGSILSLLMDDVTAIQNLVSTQSVVLLVDLVTVVLAAILLAHQHVLLFLTAAVLVPVCLVSFQWFSRRIRSETDVVRGHLDQIFQQLKTKFDGALVVKALAQEEAEMRTFAEQMHAAHAPRLGVDRLAIALNGQSLALVGIGITLVYMVGALLALRGELTPGEAVSAGVLAALLLNPLARLADFTCLYQQASTSLDRISRFLTAPSEAGPPRLEGHQFPRLGHLAFDQVSFRYVPETPVLQAFSLAIEPGKKVAVVGPTGCGKTTLMNLLQRFYDPTEGEIRLDGVPLVRIPLAELRHLIGVVPQDAVLFRASLADNIRYGAPEATQEQVEAAAQAALVHSFATSLPDGYQTILGEGGVKLSQGQRQCVAIARALCQNPALIILDEATSSLDAASEALIQTALRNLLRGRTCLVIAHRLATILDADRILVLEQGRVKQSGTHAELLAQPGLYRQLYHQQFHDLALEPAFDTMSRRAA
jgi:ABC-type multidrug transport system fused ATPase/permease subunit